MRIAHIESSMNWGGQELRIVEQTDWLNQHGHPTWIIARPDSAILREAQQRDLPVLALDIRGSANPRTYAELAQFVRTQRIDLLDCHGNRDSAYGAALKWLTGLPVVRSRHVTDPVRSSALRKLVWRTGNHGIVVTAERVAEILVEAGFAPRDRIYVAAAGFPPSAVRAAVMFTMLQSALASASEYNGLNALAAAAFGMLLWNPAWLGDISFQLSFAAVAAILAWGVPLCRRLRTRRRALNPITDALAVSLAATLATAPLVSHTFGIVPLAGVVVNPAAILLGSVVVLAGALWMLLPVGWAAPAFECVLSHTAEGLNALARVTADLPCTAAEYALGGGATAAVYLFFALATVAAWSAEPKKSVHLPA